MNKTVLLAKQHGVAIGAHPSLPDLQGFGRREMAIEPVSFSNTNPCNLYAKPFQDELKSCFIYQVGALCGFLKLHGLPLNHVGQCMLSCSWLHILIYAVDQAPRSRLRPELAFAPSLTRPRRSDEGLSDGGQQRHRFRRNRGFGASNCCRRSGCAIRSW